MQGVSNLLTYSDFFLVPIYLFLIIVVAILIKSKYIKKATEYHFFIKGLIMKLFGVSAFTIVYVFYYGGGDTVSYYLGAKSISNLLFQDFEKGFAILFNLDSPLNSWSSFNHESTYPPVYIWRDEKTFAVCRLTVPLLILSSKSFIVSSFLTSCFSYIGIWKIYRLFNITYKDNSKALAYLILYLPTLIFWGGGIMKDSYVLGATCWISYNFYKIFIVRQNIFLNIVFIIFNLLIIVNIKAYVIISLIPGMLLWLNNAYLKQITNLAIKIFIFPLLFLTIGFLGFFAINNLSSLMGVYGDVDSAIQHAQIIQDDLLREDQYGDNNYNIGELDGSFSGLISVAPVAVFTALFRPLFWEIGSPTMVISVIENSILLVFSIILLVRISPFKLIAMLLKNPFLLYCFVFSLIFAFGVGIAGTNFGALVRYKTPLVPFFFSSIYILFKMSKEKSLLDNN